MFQHYPYLTVDWRLTFFFSFSKDNFGDDKDNMRRFFGAAYSVTTGYLARAVVNNVLQGCQLLSACDWDAQVDSGEPCKIS